MRRCLQLAELAIGNVAPNPMVGAVLVYKDEIIGEGYHEKYGGPHAEVNCIASVKKDHHHLIDQSTLYVSLEPCAHWGKTPPCADLIIENKIPKVVIGCRDPFAKVNGKGIEKLMVAGVEVSVGILDQECRELNKRFFTFHEKKRTYVVLKWADTQNHKIANRPPQSPKGDLSAAQGQLFGDSMNDRVSSLSQGCVLKNPPMGGGGARLLISNYYSNRLVHKWRSEENGILVGTNTALYDDPQLNTRLYPGKNPVRLVVDMNLRLPLTLKLFDGSIPTIVFNKHKHTLAPETKDHRNLTGVRYYQIAEGVNLIDELLGALYGLNIQSILVEGGSKLLQSFIEVGAWDEARVITNEQLIISDGLPAPALSNYQMITSLTILSDVIRTYRNTIS